MGMYMYITDWDRQQLIKVTSDKEVKELFKEARELDNSLLISEYSWSEKKWFKKPVTKHRYQIFHDCSPDSSPYQARYQMSASGDKNIIMTYLYGIINGALANEKHKV